MDLDAAQLRYVRTVRKIVPIDWRETLLERVRHHGDGTYELGVLELEGQQVRMSIRARSTDPDWNFSAMLQLHVDPIVNVVRVNGPHPSPHRNRHDRRKLPPEVPNAHYLTTRYLAMRGGRRSRPEGYALMVTRCADLAEALCLLAKRANIVVGADMMRLYAGPRGNLP